MHDVPFTSLNASLPHLYSIAFFPLLFLAMLYCGLIVMRGDGLDRLGVPFLLITVLSLSKFLLPPADEGLASEEPVQDSGPSALAAVADWIVDHGLPLLIGLGIAVALGFALHRVLVRRSLQAASGRHLRELIDAIDRAEAAEAFWEAEHDDGTRDARDRTDTLSRLRHDLLELLAVVHAGQPLDTAQYAKLGNLVGDIGRCEKRDQAAQGPAPQRAIRTPRARGNGRSRPNAAAASSPPSVCLTGTLYTSTMLTVMAASAANADNCPVPDPPVDCQMADGAGSAGSSYDSGTGCDAGGGGSDP